MSIWSEGIIVGGYGRRRKDLKNACRFNRNYENLEPYFPTVPEKESFVGYWEDIDEVYFSTQKEIYINAYYVKKEELYACSK